MENICDARVSELTMSDQFFGYVYRSQWHSCWFELHNAEKWKSSVFFSLLLSSEGSSRVWKPEMNSLIPYGSRIEFIVWMPSHSKLSLKNASHSLAKLLNGTADEEKNECNIEKKTVSGIHSIQFSVELEYRSAFIPIKITGRLERSPLFSTTTKWNENLHIHAHAQPTQADKNRQRQHETATFFSLAACGYLK